MVKIRPGVEWSDGHPWSAHDFAFTINMLVEHAPELVYSTDMATWVEEVVALDSLTARVALRHPNPRFLFSYFVHSGDQGVPIVPKHIWEGKDPLTFSNFDLSKGWPVLTGPYSIVRSEPAQRIWDLREGWWAENSAFRSAPGRAADLPDYMEEHKRVQNLDRQQHRHLLGVAPGHIVSLLERNRNITTWTGREPPYSYITWWPISLGFNGLEAPWSDPEMRRAVNTPSTANSSWPSAGKTQVHGPCCPCPISRRCIGILPSPRTWSPSTKSAFSTWKRARRYSPAKDTYATGFSGKRTGSA